MTLVLGACGREPPPTFGRMPSDRGRAITGPMLDGGVPFDFRWVRIDPDSHVGKERTCDVVFVGEREPSSHRIERRYGRELGERISVRCASPSGESWLDVVFPPAAIGFAQRIRVGQRLTVEVVAPSGGFDAASVAEFRTATDGPDASVPAVAAEPASVPAAFDFRQIQGHPELVGVVQPCSVAWAGSIDRIAPELRDRFPTGATHLLSIACAHARGDSRVDLVATPRSAPDLLAIRRGQRIRVRIIALRGGAADEPLARLER